MKLTPEQDAHICAEYGVSPGEWDYDETGVNCGLPCTPDGCHEGHPSGEFELHGPAWEDVNWPGLTPLTNEADARVMAASKPMVVLLERAEKVLNFGEARDVLDRGVFAGNGDLSPLLADIRALLDGLKGGSNEEDV